MLTPRLPITLLLLSVLSTSCTENGSPVGAAPLSDGGGASAPATGINGPHTGEIWVAGESGSERFNLRTGETVKVSEGYAFPSIDGKVFVEYRKDFGHVHHPYCTQYRPDYVQAQQISVINSSTSEVLSTFKLPAAVDIPVRISNDARIAMKVAEDRKSCDGNHDNARLTVYSVTGELLHRFSDEIYSEFDWHPDGRLVVLEQVTQQDYKLLIETAPGSHKLETLLSWSTSQGFLYYTGFRVSPSGQEAVMEGVSEKAHWLSGTDWRDAETFHFNLFEPTEVPAMFVYPGESRVNGPTFSPDSKYILVTEGYFSGALVLESHYPEIGVTESLLDIAYRLPVKADSSSYIVPVDVKLQSMPPTQFSETIRPVLSYRDGKINAVGLKPLDGLSWTPVVE